MRALLAILLSWPALAAAEAPLVDVATLAPGVRAELRYATTRNPHREVLDPEPRCFLREPVARRLARVQAALAKEGLGLLAWDCHRTRATQERLWALQPDRRYVADPKRGSKHQRGAAIDLTLVDREGKPLPMPTEHDDASERAHADAPASPEATRNRARLRAAMAAQGFVPLATEWWHFDDPDSKRYPMTDVRPR